MKYCSIYFRNEGIYVLSITKTVSGVHIEGEPLYTLAPDSTQKSIGETVLKAIQAYKTGIPQPEPAEHSKSASKSPVLKALGFRSWRAFYKEAFHFNIADNGKQIEIIPFKEGGEKGALFPIPDEKQNCSSEPEAIGAFLFHFITIKRIFLFFRPEAVYLLWRMDDAHIAVLDAHTPLEIISEKIVQVFNKSKAGIFDRNDFQHISRDLLQSEGFKTWKKFSAGAQGFELNKYENTVSIAPLIEKPKRNDISFSPLSNKVRTCTFQVNEISSTLALFKEQPIAKEDRKVKVVTEPAVEPVAAVKEDKREEKDKRCLVFFREESIVIICLYKSLTTWILSEPVIKLPRQSSPESIGVAIQKIIEASLRGDRNLPSGLTIMPGVQKISFEIPGTKPDERFSKVETILVSAGYKNWELFTRKSTGFELIYETNEVSLIPLRLFHNGIFSFMPDQEAKCIFEANTLGETLLSLIKIKYADVYYGRTVLKTYTQFNDAAPYLTIPGDSPAETIGDTVLRTLATTPQVVHSLWLNWRQKLWENPAPQEDEADFKKEALFFRITDYWNSITILPFGKNTAGEFQPFRDAAVVCGQSKEEIGKALLLLGMMRRISAYVKDTIMYVIYTTDEPLLIKFELNTEAQIIGETILQAFKLTRQHGASDRGNLWKLGTANLEFAGFKNWKSFTKNALCLDLEYCTSFVRIIPKKEEHDGSFSLILDKASTCPVFPDQLGNSLLRIIGKEEENRRKGEPGSGRTGRGDDGRTGRREDGRR